MTEQPRNLRTTRLACGPAGRGSPQGADSPGGAPAAGPSARTGHDRTDAGGDWSDLAAVLELLATGRPLGEVLTALVRSFELRSPAMLGSILLLDAGGRLRHGAAPSLPDEYSRAVDGLIAGPGQGSCGTAAHERRRVIVEDVERDPLWAGYRDLARRHGLRACWSQPIQGPGGAILGTFAFYYRRPRGPDATDLRHIEAAASIAGIAIERERAERKRRAAEERFRHQTHVLLELSRSEQIAQAPFESVAQLATETAARTLEVERASVWLFDADRARMRCIDLWERSDDRHSAGAELLYSDSPNYFVALDRGRTVAADDATTHPDTCEFAQSYLAPHGITSMLDAPLRSGGEVIGALCNEHVGPPRVWTKEEQEFAASVADFVTLAREASERRSAERAAAAARERLLDMQRRERQRVEAELEKVKDQLVRQTRLAAVGQLAASIAHELRNPLGAINNAAYYLSRRLPDGDPKWAEHLGIIRDEVHASDRIISSLLETSRAKPPARSPVDLAATIEQARSAMGTRLDGMTVTLDLEPDPFVVQVDPDHLRRLLGNLLTNAAQATGRQGTVTVRARRSGRHDELLVADDGPGVADELREKLFEPLITGRAKGTGLGLAICRQIVEAHGGAIDLVQAAAPGAAFRIRLPRADGPADAPPAHGGPPVTTR